MRADEAGPPPERPQGGALTIGQLVRAVAGIGGAGGGRDDRGQGSGDLRRRRLLALCGTGIAAVALASVWWQRREPRFDPAPPDGHVVFADIEGWYRSTPHEIALRSPFDLSLDGLPEALPYHIGPWSGQERTPDPAVDEWFRDPELSIERTYRHPDGQIVWLSAFGSRGLKSYHLFEHTPETCYPLGGWRIGRFEPRAFDLDRRGAHLTTNYGEAENELGQQLVFVYLYLWRDPGRDPQAGVISLRLAAPVRRSVDDTRAALAHDFLPRLFPSTHGWSRF